MLKEEGYLGLYSDFKCIFIRKTSGYIEHQAECNISPLGEILFYSQRLELFV